ncbi:MAG: S-layer protein [Candidatus Micrarchaeota archaeon]
MIKIVQEDKSLDAIEVSESDLSILSQDRLKILAVLAREPMHSADLARELKMHDQTVYYHMKLLKQHGLIQQTGVEEKQGALAKKFECTTDALAVIIKKNWNTYRPKTALAPSFLKPFIKKSRFDGFFVIGSPEPHGKYRSRGSEFSALELSAYLGQYCSFIHPLYLLDTELKEKNKKENLIVLGGLKVNTLAEQINDFLPIHFTKRFDVYSKLSKKTYSENIGFIESIENPFNKEKRILVIAGSNHAATRVATMAVYKNRVELEKGNAFDSSVFAKVVQGFDEDGDGIVDAVEILE